MNEWLSGINGYVRSPRSARGPGDGRWKQLDSAGSCAFAGTPSHSDEEFSRLLAMEVSINAHVTQARLCYLFSGHDEDAFLRTSTLYKSEPNGLTPNVCKCERSQSSLRSEGID